MRLTSEQAAEVEEYARRCGYVEPPEELVPERGPSVDGGAWDRLHAWFEENTPNANDATLVFFAKRVGCSIGYAYEQTDSWGKRRLNTDEDGVYWSYN